LYCLLVKQVFYKKKLQKITSEEAWTLKISKVDHIKILDNVAYARIQEKKRTKLEDKSQKHMLLGYGYNSCGYKLYNTITKNVVMSRDMQFEEEQV
jgi:hypothetical protein